MKYVVRALTQRDAANIHAAFSVKYGKKVLMSVPELAKIIERKLTLPGFKWIIVEDLKGACVGVASYQRRQKKCYNVRFRFASIRHKMNYHLSNAIDAYIHSHESDDSFIGYVLFGDASQGWL